MKSAIILLIIFFALLCCTYVFSQQSSITYDAGTTIDIQTGADVCADVITITGTYSGGGSICSGALPVTLSLFNALTEKNTVKLYWKTESEINNSGFEIHRRSVDSSWKVIAFVSGRGTVNTPSEYYFEDKKLQPGSYSYRLKQLDYSGSFEYFELPLPVLISKPTEFVLGQSYPNPSNPYCCIDYQVPERTEINLRVYDILGRVITELVNEIKEPGTYTVKFDGSNFASGTYFYRITAKEFSEVKKFNIVK